jgi:hypothetical protein
MLKVSPKGAYFPGRTSSNRIDIRKLEIEVVSYGFMSATVKISGIPALVIEPKLCVVKNGMVFLFSLDRKNGNWDKLISVDDCGEVLKGCTDDPRLVKIAEIVIGWNYGEEYPPGTIVPPLTDSMCSSDVSLMRQTSFPRGIRR